MEIGNQDPAVDLDGGVGDGDPAQVHSLYHGLWCPHIDLHNFGHSVTYELIGAKYLNLEHVQ